MQKRISCDMQKQQTYNISALPSSLGNLFSETKKWFEAVSGCPNLALSAKHQSMKNFLSEIQIQT